jgi:hypothetical protein
MARNLHQTATPNQIGNCEWRAASISMSQFIKILQNIGAAVNAAGYAQIECTGSWLLT